MSCLTVWNLLLGKFDKNARYLAHMKPMISYNQNAHGSKLMTWVGIIEPLSQTVDRLSGSFNGEVCTWTKS